jgi:hypothetical protein
MSHSRLFSAFLGVLLTCAGCDKKEKQAAADTQAPAATQPADVCALLTKEEIQSVQASPIKETKSSQHVNRTMPVGQCFYTAEEWTKSVVLSINYSDPASKSSAREFWVEAFHRHEKKDKAAGQKEEAEESRPPKKIEGIGEEAYWTNALYVLQKDIFLRISLGGPEDEETKINKSKTLAEKALQRLR